MKFLKTRRKLKILKMAAEIGARHGYTEADVLNAADKFLKWIEE